MDTRDTLLSSLKTTAGSRFIASARLSARDRRLTRVTAFTSAYLILLTIFPYFFKIPGNVGDALNLITVALSVIILVSSLLQYSSGDVVNAEQHHRSALEINEQRRLLSLVPDTAPANQLEPFVAGYNAILQKYSVNHEESDYQKYQIGRPEEFTWLNRYQRTWIITKLFVIDHIPNIVLVVITLFVFGLLGFYAYPNRLESLSDKAPIQQSQSHK